jgi:hypothetical protein
MPPDIDVTTIIASHNHVILDSTKKEPFLEIKPRSSSLTKPSTTSIAVSSVIKNSLPGCEPDGKAAIEMMKIFPDIPINDIVRFLIARKGVVQDAAEMLKKSMAWREANLPLKASIATPAISTNCFLPHRKARDGTSALYFRWAFYDNTKVS